MSGLAIRNLLEKQRINCPAVILDIEIFPKHMELFCRTIEETQVVLSDLKSHTRISEELFFSIKSLPYYRTILFGVPDGTTFEYIKSTLDGIYNYNPKEISFTKAVPSKRPSSKDWHLILSKNLAMAIILDGGIPLGYNRCRLRPHTSVQRCRKCQRYGHIAKYCYNEMACDNCGELHHSETCNNPTSCLNCKRANHLFNANYRTNHKASASNCQTYKFEYDRERARLDEIFQLCPRIPQATPPNHSGPGLLGEHPPAHRGYFPYPEFSSPPHFLPPYFQEEIYSQQQNSGLQGRRF